jgi:monoamine oxidase
MTSTCEDNNDIYDCIIIGAGVCGMAASQTFSKHNSNLRIKILEVQDRIGGRICPKEISNNMELNSSSCPIPFKVECGANWIHDLTSSNPIFRLAKKNNICVHQTSCDSGGYNPYKTIISDRKHYESTGIPRIYTVEEIQIGNNLVDNYEHHMKKIHHKWKKKNRVSLRHFTSMNEINIKIISRLQNEVILNTSMQQYLSLRYQYNGFSEGYEPGSLSFHGYYDILEDDDVRGEGIIINGTSSLLESMSQNLDIQLNSRVLEIHRLTNGTVTITTDHSQFIAKSVIVTCSIGALKHKLEGGDGIAFIPPLPAAIQQSLAQCRMGLMDICVFRFATRFWESDVLAYPIDTTLFCATPPIDPLLDPTSCPSRPHETDSTHPRSDLFSHFYNLSHIRSDTSNNTPPLLLAEIYGDKAVLLESMSVADIVDCAVETLKIIFGTHVERPIGFVTHKWGSDPFTYGSWHNYNTGLTADMVAAIGKPFCEYPCGLGLGCIQIAGEGTNVSHMGTMQGAYESGVRAASHLINHHISKIS